MQCNMPLRLFCGGAAASFAAMSGEPFAAIIQPALAGKTIHVANRVAPQFSNQQRQIIPKNTVLDLRPRLGCLVKVRLHSSPVFLTGGFGKYRGIGNVVVAPIFARRTTATSG